MITGKLRHSALSINFTADHIVRFIVESDLISVYTFCVYGSLEFVAS